MMTSFDNGHNMNKIKSFGSNNIYLGSCNIYEPSKKHLIKKLNIKSILCIKDYGFDFKGLKEVNILNLSLSHKELFDVYTMKRNIKITNKFIDEALKQGSVYVHCRSGINRSPIFVMAYLVYQSHGLISPKKSYFYVFKKRPCIKPTYYKIYKKVYSKNNE